ncbi:hypothetical protein [Bradyrhizobium sp.]|uniref:hypothetical protein n=1 Tax=Bradyrhizobium sp. TaxID=376 RepID=UPI0039C867C6
MSEKAADLAMSVLESPAISPDHEAPPKPDILKPDALKAEAPRVERPNVEAARAPRRLMIMAPSDRAWHYHHAANTEAKSEARGEAAPSAPAAPKRGFGAMAAMLALATIAGAIGGALASSGFAHVADAAATTPSTSALEASVARIDADVLALKAGLERTSKLGVSQFNKTNDRLDKIEKAQAEPAAKLAKLTEAVDKLRGSPAPAAAAPAAAVPAAAREVTGSVTPPQAVATATPAPAVAAALPKPEVGRLPTVEGWRLADIGYGGALIQNRRGLYEVYAGDYIPGLGRIDAIRRQDGHWVVVTSKGLIVAR